jgi:hypothetical protein
MALCSTNTPVGSPVPSRRTSMPLGGTVSRVIEAARSAAEFATE